MADTPITDTAILAGALVLHADDDTQLRAWALLTEQQQDAYRHAAHRVLDAALPHLTAAKDETAKRSAHAPAALRGER